MSTRKIEKDIFKKGSTTYYLSSRLFPRRIREDVFKLYSFVRVADDYVDEEPRQPRKLLALEEAYKKAITDETFESITHDWDDVDTRVIKNIVQLARRYKFEPEWVPAFFAAMKSDVNPKPCTTLDMSLVYVYGSAEVVGLMMMRLMGVDKRRNIKRVLSREAAKKQEKTMPLKTKVPAVAKRKVRERFKAKVAADETYDKEIALIRASAQAQGRAMQWINFIRDLKDDNERGRQYLPTSDLKKAGLKDVKEETAREHEAAFKKLVTLEIERYRAWQTEAEAAYRFIPQRYLTPLKTAVDSYNWTATQIEKDPLKVFSKKIKPRKRRMLLRAPKRVARRLSRK